MTQQGSGTTRAVAIEITKSDQALHIAPTIYIDGAQGIIANEQMVKFNLFQDRLVGADGSDPNVPVERVVCARLVMSPATFRALTDWLVQNAKAIFPAQAT